MGILFHQHWRWTATKFEPRPPETILKLLQQKNKHVYVQKSFDGATLTG